MLLSLDMTSIKKLAVCDCKWLKKIIKRKELLKHLLMSTHDCTCSCWKYERKAMQIIRRAYANSLLNEKKKPTQNQGQCTYLFLHRKRKNVRLLIIITLTKQPPLTVSVEKRESLHSSLTTYLWKSPLYKAIYISHIKKRIAAFSGKIPLILSWFIRNVQYFLSSTKWQGPFKCLNIMAFTSRCKQKQHTNSAQKDNRASNRNNLSDLRLFGIVLIFKSHAIQIRFWWHVYIIVFLKQKTRWNVHPIFFWPAHDGANFKSWPLLNEL